MHVVWTVVGRFLYELSQIPSFVDRCFCLLFQSTFTESLTLIDSRLTNVRLVMEVSLPLTLMPSVFMSVILDFYHGLRHNVCQSFMLYKFVGNPLNGGPKFLYHVKHGI